MILHVRSESFRTHARLARPAEYVLEQSALSNQFSPVLIQSNYIACDHWHQCTQVGKELLLDYGSQYWKTRESEELD